ncbi:hypothetical protein GKC49_10610 [Pantoea agglomerans]|uniref:Uncharacterized protein n=1 Tax=Enterobacter agglomerans TaxID=549 RepID=A0A7X2SVJ9_ENTAG|nr:hypothetical protein [Pantoea agglomerans]
MSKYSAGKLKHLVNKNLEQLNCFSNDLIEHLILVHNFNDNNQLFTLDIDGGELRLKSEPFDFYPFFKGKLVTNGDELFWRGQFHHKNEIESLIPLTSLYIDIHGRVSINNLNEWDYGIQSDELYAEITSSVFDAAISMKLITP